MPGKLTGSRELFEVPDGLTYFAGDGEYLVVNPHAGGRCVLDPREFGVLRALARPAADGAPAPLDPTPETERTLAKLILSWVVYYNGNHPVIRLSEPALRTVYYAITDGCNLRCPYCYASSEKCLPGELGTAESLDLVSRIAGLGAGTLVFTGGEPMLRKDLFQIAAHANDSGLRSNIITNATMIRKPAQAARVAELFSQVTVSMDGGTAETHDRTRGAGAFDKTYRALRLLNDAGVTPNINHIVTSENVDHLEDFATFLEGLRVDAVRLMYHNNLGRGVTDEYDFGWADHLRIQQLVWTRPVAARLRPLGPKPISPCSIKGNCGMGGSEIYINSLGDVYPCKLVTGREHFAGNVRRQSLEEIFATPVLRGMRTSTVFGGDYHADCERCYIKATCGGGCRAAHMAESGDVRRNSRHLCRILRHGVVTQMWQEAGVDPLVIAAHDAEMSTPRLVATDEVHAVYDDWKTFVPVSPVPVPPPGPAGGPAKGVRVGELLSITPVR
ncbi:radical SAM protein [Actinomadura sp. ATCC 31491]|uniref:Radical SAM protein n=1 Tax=Actinomadura luzonensis TaxID=2805427 RepID=A0ABT0G798_9ACTN|nr:StsB family radical SAM/SPASM domain sactipeptide maturase [Actinomadura luzonensis]MCK2220394.1 radical SAM protein [Actinomadura luzonensis]